MGNVDIPLGGGNDVKKVSQVDEMKKAPAMEGQAEEKEIPGEQMELPAGDFDRNLSERRRSDDVTYIGRGCTVISGTVSAKTHKRKSGKPQNEREGAGEHTVITIGCVSVTDGTSTSKRL